MIRIEDLHFFATKSNTNISVFKSSLAKSGHQMYIWVAYRAVCLDFSEMIHRDQCNIWLLLSYTSFEPMHYQDSQSLHGRLCRFVAVQYNLHKTFQWMKRNINRNVTRKGHFIPCFQRRAMTYIVKISEKISHRIISQYSDNNQINESWDILKVNYSITAVHQCRPAK